MATLRELVKFRNDLIARSKLLTLDEPIDQITQLLNLTVIENSNINKLPVHDKIDHVINEFQQLKEKSSEIRRELIDEINTIDQTIDSLAKDFNTDITIDIPVFEITPDTNHLILARIQKYADWRFSALRLGCKYVGQYQIDIVDNIPQRCNLLSIEYSNQLITGDPLYFCDRDKKLIDSVTDHFNDTYRRRTRTYTIFNDDLSILPQNQFSFIFSWMMFNFFNLEITELYLRNIFNLLRPGGTLMFSYNNSDLEQSADLVDTNLMYHTPKRILTDLCKTIGFELTAEYDVVNNDSLIKYISWLEIRRPGELHTIKLQPVMGQILGK
jgi:hypothetical protein